MEARLRAVSFCQRKVNPFSSLLATDPSDGRACSELAEMAAATVGYQGEIAFDKSKPDGTPTETTGGNSTSSLGWRHSIALASGIKSTYQIVLRAPSPRACWTT